MICLRYKGFVWGDFTIQKLNKNGGEYKQQFWICVD